MKNIPILIIPSNRQYSVDEGKSDIDINVSMWYKGVPMRELQRSNIVIVKGPVDFCCIKNRWSATKQTQRIPNFLLRPFLEYQYSRFSKDELIDILIDTIKM